MRGASIAGAALKRIPLALGLAGLAAQIALTASNPARYQIDLLPYLSARTPGSALQPGDLYPPYRPLLIAPLAGLPPLTAYYVFLAARIGILLGVLWLALALLRGDGSRGRKVDVGPFILFAALGFNAALGFDLRIGNVATVEVLFLLLAFRSLLRGHQTRGMVFILIAGSFKILPLAFLGLLWLPRSAGARRTLGIGVTAALALLLVPLAVEPALLAGVRTVGRGFDSMRGPVDSSLLALCRDLVRIGSGRADPAITWLAYLTAGGAVLIASLQLVRRLLDRDDDLPLAISVLMLAYVLVAPRMVTYSYALALVPVYLIWSRTGWTPVAKASFLAACLPTQQVLWRALGRAQDAPVGSAGLLPLEYWNWLVVFAIWLLALRRAHHPRTRHPAHLDS